MDIPPNNEQADLMSMVEMAELRAEVEALRQEVAELQQESDIDACHIAGLTAQIKALIEESDACPNKDAHPLMVRANYPHSQTGRLMLKTSAYPLYRQAFDAEARARGIEEPEKYRS